MTDDKDALIRRLSRIEGQVRGVSRMIDEDRYCIEVLQQVQAIKAALERVEDVVLRDHTRTCVQAAIESGDADEQCEKFNELVELFARVKR